MLVISEYVIAILPKTHISHIFPYIMAFSKSLMPHMPHIQKFAYTSHICHIFPHMRSHFSAFLLSSFVLNIFDGKRLPVFTIKSRGTVYAGNMRKNMPHICDICSTYTPHISQNSAYFPAYFASKSSAYFKKILRYKPASLVRGQREQNYGSRHGVNKN